MDFYIVIPAYNEEAYIAKTLQSLIQQTHPAKRIVVVDDNSTDKTFEIAQTYSEKYQHISIVSNSSEEQHLPGSKVIKAFYSGWEQLDKAYDIVCKFDADLIFPENYLEQIALVFQEDPKCGMAGGFCYIQKGENWILESLTNKDHIRGALKAYRKDCFEMIGGLKKSMGWDSVDELLSKYHGWEVVTLESLHVKHLKPTGHSYDANAGKKQGEAFKKMRYGLVLTLIASGKLALKKKKLGYFFSAILGYLKTKDDYLLSQDEGKFVRNLRWKAIRGKLFG